MFDRLLRRINHLANWQTVLFLFVCLLPFNAYLFPQRSARFRQLTGEASPALDVRFAYSPPAVSRFFERLGSEGRQLYLQTELTVDLVYPVLYATLACFLLAVVWRAAFRPDSPWQKVALIPYLMLLADYSENFCLVFLLGSYPRQSMTLAQVASIFTSAKWIIGGLSLLLLVVGLARLAQCAYGRLKLRRAG